MEDFISIFSPEIYVKIINHLNHKDRCALDSTCTFFNKNVFPHVRSLCLKENDVARRIIPRYHFLRKLKFLNCPFPSLKSIQHITTLKSFKWIPSIPYNMSVKFHNSLAVFLLKQPLEKIKFPTYMLRLMSNYNQQKIVSIPTLRRLEVMIPLNLINFINLKVDYIGIKIDDLTISESEKFDWKCLHRFLPNTKIHLMGGCPTSEQEITYNFNFLVSDIVSCGHIDFVKRLRNVKYTNIRLYVDERSIMFPSYVSYLNRNYIEAIIKHPTIKYLEINYYSRRFGFKMLPPEGIFESFIETSIFIVFNLFTTIPGCSCSHVSEILSQHNVDPDSEYVNILEMQGTAKCILDFTKEMRENEPDHNWDGEALCDSEGEDISAEYDSEYDSELEDIDEYDIESVE